MAKVAEFNKMTAMQMRKVLEAKFAEIEAETGVKLKIGNIAYNQNTFRTKLEAVIAAKEVENAQSDWNRKCMLYGLSPEDYGKTFMSHGIKMRMFRIDTKKYKMPIICEGSDGKNYKFNSMSVKAMIAQI